MNRSLIASALAAALVAPVVSAADTAAPGVEARLVALEADLQALHAQAEQAQEALATALAEIERLKAAAATPAVADPFAAVAAAAPDPTAAPAASAGGNGTANAFNPAISLLLSGAYAHHTLDPDDYVRAGFPLIGEGGPGEQGLALGESELTLSANIDDKFYGQLTLAVASEGGETELEVEEAFVDTTALPGGLQLRLGRFLSNIGYLNNHHGHTDRFSDRPLPYQAFLGGHYGDDGVQLRWVAPTDTFLEFGGELLRGDRFGSDDGVGATTLFAHAGGDVGSEHAWLAGVSVLDARGGDGVGEDGFRGDTRLWIADGTWKWAPDGNHQDGGLTLRGEVFVEHRDGDVVIDVDDPALDQPWRGSRRGGYLEATWRINRRWETGIRHDRLWAADDGPFASDFDPRRSSVMLAWRNSEFSLWRLQLGRDEPEPDATDDVVTLEYQHSLGAHGAHKF